MQQYAYVGGGEHFFSTLLFSLSVCLYNISVFNHSQLLDSGRLFYSLSFVSFC